jgi:hypothetical protein
MRKRRKNFLIMPCPSHWSHKSNPPVELAETENQQNGAGQRETVPRPRRNARCKVNGAPRHVGIQVSPTFILYLYLVNIHKSISHLHNSLSRALEARFRESRYSQHLSLIMFQHGGQERRNVTKWMNVHVRPRGLSSFLVQCSLRPS